MFCSINLLFGEVLAAVAIVFCERSLITSMNKRTILIIKLNPPLKPLKTKYRSGIAQADKDAYLTWLCLASESTGSRLPRVVGIILLGPVFTSNFVFTWINPLLAFARVLLVSCVAGENHAGFLSSKLTAITVIVSWYLRLRKS